MTAIEQVLDNIRAIANLSCRAQRGGRRDQSQPAFDHHAILRDGVERALAKLEYSALATDFRPSEFTVGELRAVYERCGEPTSTP